MLELSAIGHERVLRVLQFLGVAGGAALISATPRRVVAHVGEIDPNVVTELLAMRLTESIELGTLVHAGRDTVLADLGCGRLLAVRVPAGLYDHAFAMRVERGAALLRRFVFTASGGAPPPSSAPAEARVWASSVRRTKSRS